MNKRIAVNVALFGAMFLALLWWDLNNVLRLDAIKRPYPVSATFATSPGLRAGFGVAYLGVPVGKISSVKLTHGAVDVHMKIDRGVSLPARIDASVRRRSAIGEPYVDLRPSGGAGGDGARLRPGAHIPLSRTSVPLEYSQVFDSIAKVVEKLPVADLNELLREVAAGIGGRADDFRTLVASTSQLTATLAKSSPLLDQISNDLTTLTHTIAAHRGSLGEGFDNVADLARLLAEQRDNLTALLDRTPSFASDFNALLEGSGSSIGCIFDSAGSLWSAIDKPAILSSLDRLVAIAPQAADVVRALGFQGPDGFYMNGSLILELDLLDAPRIFDRPLTLPAVQPIRPCTAPARSGSAGTPAATAGGGQASSGPGAHSVPTPGRPTQGAAAPEPSSQKRSGSTGYGRYALPALVAILLTAAAATLTMRPWRRLLPGRRGRA